jgi:hypothetical protein
LLKNPREIFKLEHAIKALGTNPWDISPLTIGGLSDLDGKDFTRNKKNLFFIVIAAG